jgi:hypothetical protein
VRISDQETEVSRAAGAAPVPLRRLSRRSGCAPQSPILRSTAASMPNTNLAAQVFFIERPIPP